MPSSLGAAHSFGWYGMERKATVFFRLKRLRVNGLTKVLWFVSIPVAAIATCRRSWPRLRVWLWARRKRNAHAASTDRQPPQVSCRLWPRARYRQRRIRLPRTPVLTDRHYFQASLVLPLVVPLVLALTAFLTSSQVIDGFAAVFMFSLMLGGIPYLIFAAGVLIWSRSRPASAIRRLSYFAPVLLVIGTDLLSLMALFFGISPREVLAFVVIFSSYALIFGYLYVFIINFLYEAFFGRQSDI